MEYLTLLDVCIYGGLVVLNVALMCVLFMSDTPGKNKDLRNVNRSFNRNFLNDRTDFLCVKAGSNLIKIYKA